MDLAVQLAKILLRLVKVVTELDGLATLAARQDDGPVLANVVLLGEGGVHGLIHHLHRQVRPGDLVEVAFHFAQNLGVRREEEGGNQGLGEVLHHQTGAFARVGGAEEAEVPLLVVLMRKVVEREEHAQPQRHRHATLPCGLKAQGMYTLGVGVHGTRQVHRRQCADGPQQGNQRRRRRLAEPLQVERTHFGIKALRVFARHREQAE